MLLALAVALVASSFLPGYAQDVVTNATCFERYNWMRNSKGQSPCLIAAWLNVPCNFPPAYQVSPIGSGIKYIGPDENSPVIPCDCNTVRYSVHAACAWCQGHEDGLGIVDWPEWSEHCPETQINVFPLPIPDGTAIPAWAYANLTNDKWDELVASSLAQENLPESTAAPSVTFSAPSSSSTGTLPPTSPTSISPTSSAPISPSSPASMNAAEDQRSVVGPAVGGAVGGVVVVLLAIGAWLYLRRRRRPSQMFAQQEEPNKAAVFDNGIHDGSSYDYPVEPDMSQTLAYPLYDPNDPRTFPPPQTPVNDPDGTERTLIASSLHYPLPADRSVARMDTAVHSGYTGKAEIA